MKVAYLGGRKGVRRKVRTKLGLLGGSLLGDEAEVCVGLCGLKGVWDMLGAKGSGGRTDRLPWCRILADEPKR